MERRTLDEAANWFARLKDPEVQSAAREEFAQWLLGSPNNIRAFLGVVRAWGDIALIGNSFTAAELVNAARSEAAAANVITMPPPAKRAEPTAPVPEPVPSRRRFMQYAAAAGLVGVATSFGWYAHEHRGYRSHYRTAVGEQRSFTLPDGSIVHLNTDSQVSIQLTQRERRIVLTRGEGRFTVAKDKNRPFTVTTPHAAVRALGTVFNVQVAAERTAIAVIEGRIEVRGNADKSRVAENASHRGSSEPIPGATQAITGQVILHTGEQAAVTPRGEILPNAGPPLERVNAWPDRQLVFRDEPLGDLIADFNRYHNVAIRIADPEITTYRVSGTFNAYDRASLLAYFVQVHKVRIVEAPDGSEVLLLMRQVQEVSR